jgi:fatty-acyl-CoA synthase
VRGPNVFSSTGATLRPRPRRCATAGIIPGDIGTRDADGHFFIHDRKKNMIISGGENIYPAEVERVLVAHPDVAEGRRDRPRRPEMAGGAGRLCGAAARLRRCDAHALEAHLLTQLARFKVPREYVFVDALPRNAMGKVQHFMLREARTQ